MAPSVSSCRRSARTIAVHSTTHPSLRTLDVRPQLVRTRDLSPSQLSSNRTSKRFSTFSGAPSVSSDATVSTTQGDPRLQDIKELTQGLERLNSHRLQQQRYAPSKEKSEDLSKLALGAKVERALGRRMTGQDAVLKQKPTLLSEKTR